MITMDDCGDLVDESNPSEPPWPWLFWLMIIIVIFEGCIRRGV